MSYSSYLALKVDTMIYFLGSECYLSLGMVVGSLALSIYLTFFVNSIYFKVILFCALPILAYWFSQYPPMPYFLTPTN